MSQTLTGTIWGGVTISASPATASVPTGYLVNEYDCGSSITRTITIPNNVHVINVYAYAKNNAGGASDEYRDVSVEIYRNNKKWGYNSNSNTGSVGCNRDIGVTPNKQYTVSMYANGNEVYSIFQIEYSPTINNVTPDVYDY